MYIFAANGPIATDFARRRRPRTLVHGLFSYPSCPVKQVCSAFFTRNNLKMHIFSIVMIFYVDNFGKSPYYKGGEN